MERPICPCKQDCDARSARCHNETCPYGYGEYEKQMKVWVAEKDKEFAKRPANATMTAGKKSNIHNDFMRRKRSNKF